MSTSVEVVPFRTIKIEWEFQIAAPRERVWRALAADVDKWWGYRCFPEPTEMTLDPQAGGMLRERTPRGDSGLWGTVLEVRPLELFRMADNFGSFNPECYGIAEWTFEEKDGGTLVKFCQRIGGHATDKLVESLDKGWKHLIGKFFKEWVENGTAAERGG